MSTLVVGLIALILCLLQARERRQQWISTHEMFNAACLLTSQATLHTIPQNKQMKRERGWVWLKLKQKVKHPAVPESSCHPKASSGSPRATRIQTCPPSSLAPKMPPLLVGLQPPGGLSVPKMGFAGGKGWGVGIDNPQEVQVPENPQDW